MKPTGVIIVAGGEGRRCGGRIPKQFRLLGGRPVLARTIDRFAEALPGTRIVVVLPAAGIPFWHNLCARFRTAPHTVAEGGAERFHSVVNGLSALDEEVELIAVQDAVRPLASTALIRRTMAEADRYGAAIPVVEAVDSYRETDGEGSRPIDRSRLRIVQTPQAFRAAVLREAYRAPFDPSFTDDASVVERAGHTIRLMEGERTNLKLTAPEDFAVAEALLTVLNGDDRNDGIDDAETRNNDAEVGNDGIAGIGDGDDKETRNVGPVNMPDIADPNTGS